MSRKSRIHNPELFQGIHKSKNYFEGWYFKHTDRDAKVNFSIIPGINMEKNEKSAFIQIIIGPEYRSYFIPYDYSEFSYCDQPFEVRIGRNVFSLDGISLDIDTENIQICGKIEYNNITPIECSLMQPNIMGYFGYLKFMQCNHGVISLSHNLKGKIEHDDRQISFDGGRGYIEKDWGSSFPQKYCWVQCNHFPQESTSLFFSFAHIPFLGTSFMGFICILKVGERQYRFATYNKSKMMKIDYENDTLIVEMKRHDMVIKIRANATEALALKAPKQGRMTDEIKETLQGNVEVELEEGGKKIYEGKSTNGAMDIVDM
ncbi:MAG: tocopherol cyclase family protein [Eubacteriales bacterium]